jgi:hypothetical protein
MKLPVLQTAELLPKSFFGLAVIFHAVRKSVFWRLGTIRLDDLMQFCQVATFVERAALFRHVPHVLGNHGTDLVPHVMVWHPELLQFVGDGKYSSRFVGVQLAFDDSMDMQMGLGTHWLSIFAKDFIGQLILFPRTAPLGMIPKGDLERGILGQLSFFLSHNSFLSGQTPRKHKHLHYPRADTLVNT